MAWPKQTPAALNKFYGNPDANRDGLPDPKWEAANLVAIAPPYQMVLAWNPKAKLKTIRVHKDCAESLMEILEAILEHYGSQAAVEKARMHLYGGCYNFRLMRGGSSLSTHSWGCAIDLDPERNGFGVPYREGRGMMPMAVVAIFEARGWDWGGLWKKADAMHFQAAKTGQKAASGARVVPPQPAPRLEREPEVPVEQLPPGRDPMVEAVQRALVEKGYPEVGKVDGRAGRKTRAAIRAFEDENGLPDTGEASADLLAAITLAPHRPVSVERATATPAEVRAEVPGAQANFLSKVGAWVLGVPAAIGTVVTGTMEALPGAREWLDPVQDIAADVPPLMWFALVGGVALAIFLVARKGERAERAAYRTGERL